MKSWLKIMSVAAGVLAVSASFAQMPAGAPAGSTGLCKDGSYWTGPTKSGACSGHKGVKTWYAAAAAASSSAPAAMTPAAAAPAAAAATPPPPAPAAKPAVAPAASVAQAPGGGPGMVWGNKSSKVYHCPTDKWYGKTKNGEYMTEAAAKAAGYHAENNKTCGG